jgi:hypothetical protein
VTTVTQPSTRQREEPKDPTGNPPEARRELMRARPSPKLAWLALFAALSPAAPARSAELFVSGDLGISWVSGKGVGTNDIVAISNSGSSEDATTVYGGALGAVFPMNAALPWKMRMPGFGVPYWPGRELRFREGDEMSFPAWPVRLEVEHLRGRSAHLTTPSFNPFDAYRLDVKSWTLMGKLRVDLPISPPVQAVYGRVPFLEPFSLYGGAGAGIAETEFAVSTGLLAGSKTRQRFSWQADAGVGYELSDHVKLSVGWRYIDFGQAQTDLIDQSSTNRGRYSIDLAANEFTTSLTVWFWRLPPLLGQE